MLQSVVSCLTYAFNFGLIFIYFAFLDIDSVIV